MGARERTLHSTQQCSVTDTAAAACETEHRRQLDHVQIPDRWKLRDNKYALSSTATLVVVCYAAWHRKQMHNSNVYRQMWMYKRTVQTHSYNGILPNKKELRITCDNVDKSQKPAE